MSREGRPDCCMSIHHSITSRGLLIIDSEPTDVGSGHMWKFIVSRAPTNMLQTCARYVTRIMCDFPLESTAPTKTNIPKHRLAQLYDYATHPWSALILKITKKVMNQHYLCTASPGWMGGFLSFHTLHFADLSTNSHDLVSSQQRRQVCFVASPDL